MDREDAEEMNSPEDELPAIRLCRTSGKDKLDLSHNRLKFVTMPRRIFDLKHLQYLYLEGNGIKEIPVELCENLTRLLWLDLRRNALVSLPGNISLLSKLKNLLLEGNQIEKLPLELGLLANLSGLNLRDNPLTFPSQEIISLGTKEIIRYLRDYEAQSRQRAIAKEDEHVDQTTEKTKGVQSDKSNSYSNHKNDNEDGLMQKFQKFPVGVYADALDDITDDGRRMSLEENMIQLLRYSVNSLDIKERSKSFPKYTLPSLRTKNIFLDKRGSSESNTQKSPVPGEEIGDDDPLYTSTKSTLRRTREVSRAALRRFNEKTDKTLQARKNKKMLDDWRRRNKKTESKKKHEIVIPYGHTPATQDDAKEDGAPVAKADKQPVETKSKSSEQRSELKMNRLSLDEELDNRIKEHVQNIKNWRRKNNNNNTNSNNDSNSSINNNKGNNFLEDELLTTSKNLEKAHQVQKELQERRTREYRFQAFTGGEFVPPAHANNDIPVEK